MAHGTPNDLPTPITVWEVAYQLGVEDAQAGIDASSAGTRKERAHRELQDAAWWGDSGLLDQARAGLIDSKLDQDNVELHGAYLAGWHVTTRHVATEWVA